jgi:hypothetical protein
MLAGHLYANFYSPTSGQLCFCVFDISVKVIAIISFALLSFVRVTKIIKLFLSINRIRGRPGTKYSRCWDQVNLAEAGINLNFEMFPGPGSSSVSRDRDFLYNSELKLFKI